MAAALVALFAWIVLTANVAFALGTGIECGWQPMPDGSASYECVVRLEPVLLNSLQRGDSIPLSVDVPEHIRPISRIRLVAGDVHVPHETLATNLKAWPEAHKKSREGVVETQFTTNNIDPRYANQQPTNGAVVPLNGYTSNAQDALARSLQNGGQAVREAVGQVTQDVLPPDPGRSVANAVDRASQELGNNLRSASDTVQNDIRQMFGNEPVAAGGSEILPPSGQQSQSSSNQQAQPILPGDSSTANNNRRRLDQPINPNQGSNWQSSQIPTNNATASNPIAPPNNFDTQWQADTRSPAPTSVGGNTSAITASNDRYGSAAPFAGNNAQVLPQNSNSAAMNPTDRYGNATQTPTGGLPSADSRNSTASGSQTANSGPSFPPFTPSVGTEQSPITPTPMNASSTPEIRAHMLNQPANAEIQGANGLPIGQQPLPATQVATQSPPAQAASAASDFGWNTKPQTQQTVGPQTAAPQIAGPTGTAPNSVFPLLLSWVLLSGSGAGNLYLFWSYLDVRNKYRDLVDEAARRISGRRIRD